MADPETTQNPGQSGNGFKGVLLPVSFHESMKRLQDLARFLRKFGTTRVVLLHVVSSGLARSSQTTERMERIRNEVGPLFEETETIVGQGSPALEICRVAEERQTRFIALPWKRKDFLQRTLLGSTTQDVVRLSTLPVFVYKGEVSGKKPGDLRRILYAVNFDQSHRRILEYLRTRELTATDLYAVHVGERAPDPVTEQARREGVFNRLNELLGECADWFHTLEPVSLVGNPKRELLKAAKRNRADVIIMGKFSHGGALEKLVGSTAETVTRKARCSVLIVPARGSLKGEST